MWLKNTRKIMIAQNIRLPSWPLGRKLIIMVPPMNITNIINGVSKPQIGHIAKMKLQNKKQFYKDV